MVALSASRLVWRGDLVDEVDDLADLVGGRRQPLHGVIGALAVRGRLVGDASLPARRAG